MALMGFWNVLLLRVERDDSRDAPERGHVCKLFIQADNEIVSITIFIDIIDPRNIRDTDYLKLDYWYNKHYFCTKNNVDAQKMSPDRGLEPLTLRWQET